MKLAETLQYKDGGLIPALVQDEAGVILMVAYMNRESVELTEATRVAVFWSRSRRKPWKKGEQSGNVLEVLEIRADCDNDCLLLKCRPRGPACHTGYYSCFYQVWDGAGYRTDGKKLDDPEKMYGNK